MLSCFGTKQKQFKICFETMFVKKHILNRVNKDIESQNKQKAEETTINDVGEVVSDSGDEDND